MKSRGWIHQHYPKKLSGLVGVHADDFNTMGTDEFHKKVTDPLQEVSVFGKVENHKYRFTGVDINALRLIRRHTATACSR